MPRVVSSLRRIAGSIASSTALSSPSGLAPLSFTAQRLLATHARGTALSSAPSNFFASRERKSEGLTPCGCRVHDVCLHGTTMHGTRAFSSSPADIDKAVEEINELFVEARDEIEFAGEDSETVYFNESVTEAKKAVDDCLDKWNALLARLPEAEAGKLQRSMGLKMEQLKAEFEILRRRHLDDH